MWWERGGGQTRLSAFVLHFIHIGNRVLLGISASVYYHLDRKSRDASAVCIGLGEGEAEKQLIVTSPRKLCKAFVEFVFVSRLL